MKRLSVLLAALAVFVALPTAAVAQEHFEHNSPKADFHLSNALVIGTTTVPPGDYEFQCVFENGKHFLVVIDADGREVARVPCRPEQLKTKIPISDFRSVTRPDGQAALTALRVKGELIEHRLILD